MNIELWSDDKIKKIHKMHGLKNDIYVYEKKKKCKHNKKKPKHQG
jgi:hypothetical protein